MFQMMKLKMIVKYTKILSPCKRITEEHLCINGEKCLVDNLYVTWMLFNKNIN